MKFLKYLIKDVIVPNVIWIALLSIPSAIYGIIKIGELIILLGNNQIVAAEMYMLIIACCAICIITLICNGIFAIYCIINKKSKPSFPALNTDYRILNSELELYFEDRHTIISSQSIEFEVSSDSLEEISHSMVWTGQKYGFSQLDADSKNRGYKLVDSDRKTSPFNVVISFPEGLKQGETGHYKFETHVKDEQKLMIPVLSRLVKYRTDKLTLRITASEGVIKNANKLVSADIDRAIILNNPIKINPKKIGNLQSYEWHVENPELLRNYFIEWVFF